MIHLGVNIDHVATVRQARRGFEPDPLEAAQLCERAGCHGITVHLREDARHIQRSDVEILRARIRTRLNLEMSLAPAVVDFAKGIRPHSVCLVPENRQEITTEGGLAVSGREGAVGAVVEAMRKLGSEVSLFIEPDEREIRASAAVGGTHIEIHTGKYALLERTEDRNAELGRILRAVILGRELGLAVNAGHGINYHNVIDLARERRFHEFNIGHSLIARALLTGLEAAVRDMLQLMNPPSDD